MIFGMLSNHRRYCLARWASAREIGDDIAAVWRYSHDSSPGTPLPAEFPMRADLVAFGYTCLEDLEGAEVAELTENLEFSEGQATSVLTAAAAA